MYRTLPLIAVIAMLALPAAGHAAKYAKTITVSKTGGKFNSPVKALASITGATAKAPVLVKLLPGTYDLGQATLQMKEHVDVEGSGVDKTIITSSIVNKDGDTCSVATVKMASDSTIRNLRVVNSTRSTVDGLTAGVVFDNVKATAENIKVVVGSDTVATPRNYGICSVGSGARATLAGVNVDVHNGTSGQAGAVALLSDGSMTIQGSKLAASAAKEGHTHVIDCANGQAMSGTLTIDKSQLLGTILDAEGGNRGIDVRDCRATITNTTVNLSGGDDNIGIITDHQPTTVDASKIYSPGKALLSGGAATLVINNSVIQGEIPAEQRLRLKQNVDETGRQIPNR